jgi:SAM-dependent methyltransferase
MDRKTEAEKSICAKLAKIISCILYSMLRQLIRPLYESLHRQLYRTRHWNPLLLPFGGGRPASEGPIADEHLRDPSLDQRLEEDFRAMGLALRPFRIDIRGYQAYLEQAAYPVSYYGGGLDPAQNFTEKTLEHYVSLQLLQLKPGQVLLDMAAATSPFAAIARRICKLGEAYQQDLVYPHGIHEGKIGGWGHETGLPASSVDGVTLHCSLEHFEGRSDTLLFQELERILRPGGKAVVLPFYLAHTYTIHLDPAYNLLKLHRPALDPQAQRRYSDWRQYFSRHYDPDQLKHRILSAAPGLELTLHRISNFQEAGESCYLRWAGVFRRRY